MTRPVNRKDEDRKAVRDRHAEEQHAAAKESERRELAVRRRLAEESRTDGEQIPAPRRRDLLAPHPDPRTESYLARLVDEAPPLTGAHRDRIVRLLQRAEHDRTTPGEARPAA